MGLLVDGKEAYAQLKEAKGHYYTGDYSEGDLYDRRTQLVPRFHTVIDIPHIYVDAEGGVPLPNTRRVAGDQVFPEPVMMSYDYSSGERAISSISRQYALWWLESMRQAAGIKSDIWVPRVVDGPILTAKLVAINGMAMRRIGNGHHGWDVEATQKALGVEDLRYVPLDRFGILAGYEEIIAAIGEARGMQTYSEVSGLHRIGRAMATAAFGLIAAAKQSEDSGDLWPSARYGRFAGK